MKYIFQHNKKTRCFFVFSMVVLLNTIGFGQKSDYINHAKYWYYRTRLRNDFMMVGPGQGMSIPMQERGYFYLPYTNTTNPNYTNFTSVPNGADGQTAKWGDSMGDLGYYIGVLATEYYLLSQNSQPQKTDSTLKELYYALWALNRMDMNADEVYNAFCTSKTRIPIPSGYNFNPLTSNSYLNGFSIRDDIDVGFVYSNYKHFNYYGNRGFCSQIKINNEYGPPGNEGYETCFSSVTLGGATAGAFISQDNWYNVLLGIALVEKFVPANTFYKGLAFQDGNADIKKEAMQIANRVYNYFINDRDLTGQFILYPDGSNIAANNGGWIRSYLFAHSEAIGRMRNASYNYYNPTEGTHNDAFHDACDKNNYLNTGNGFTKWWRKTFGITIRHASYWLANHSTSQLSNTTDYDEQWWKAGVATATSTKSEDLPVIVTNLLAICNCYYDFETNKTGTEMYGPEFSTYQYATTGSQAGNTTQRDLYHGQLIRAALFGSEKCQYGEANVYPQNELNAVWFNTSSLLETAPCEGTFAYATGDGPVAPYEWKTTTRLDWPQRRNNTTEVDFPAEYNGIDYMLYHNLYYIVEKQITSNMQVQLVDFSNRILTVPYPLTANTNASSPWGSSSNPATVAAYEVINASCTFNSNAVATLVAGKEIQWGNGISILPGSNVSFPPINVPSQLNCASIFNQVGYDNINARKANTGDTKPHEYYASLPTTIDSTVLKNNLAQASAPKNIVVPLVTTSNKISASTAKVISNASLAQSSSVYPNPNNGSFILLLNSPDKVRSFQIQSVLGETVYESGNAIAFENSIDISNLPSGVYILNIYDKSYNVCTKKLIKN